MKNFILLFFLFILSEKVLSQTNSNQTTIRNSANVIVVKMKDGAVIKGYMISQDKDFLYLKEVNTLEEIKIPVNRIRQVDVLGVQYVDAVAAIQEEVVLTKDTVEAYFQHNSQYILSTSAYNLKAGEKLIRNNPTTLQVGLKDNFSIGVGSAFSSLIIGTFTLFVNSKYTIKINELVALKVGVDAVGVLPFIDEAAEAAILLNGGVSLGIPEAHITATTYYGALTGLGGTGFFYSLSGKVSLSKQLSFVTESFLMPQTSESDEALSYLTLLALRLHAKSFTFDAGYLTNPEINEFLPVLGIPFIAFSVSLN